MGHLSAPAGCEELLMKKPSRPPTLVELLMWTTPHWIGGREPVNGKTITFRMTLHDRARIIRALHYVQASRRKKR